MKIKTSRGHRARYELHLFQYRIVKGKRKVLKGQLLFSASGPSWPQSLFACDLGKASLEGEMAVRGQGR